MYKTFVLFVFLDKKLNLKSSVGIMGHSGIDILHPSHQILNNPQRQQKKLASTLERNANIRQVLQPRYCDFTVTGMVNTK